MARSSRIRIHNQTLVRPHWLFLAHSLATTSYWCKYSQTMSIKWQLIPSSSRDISDNNRNRIAHYGNTFHRLCGLVSIELKIFQKLHNIPVSLLSPYICAVKRCHQLVLLFFLACSGVACSRSRIKSIDIASLCSERNTISSILQISFHSRSTVIKSFKCGVLWQAHL